MNYKSRTLTLGVIALASLAFASCSIFKGNSKNSDMQTASPSNNNAKTASSETALTDALIGDWAILDIEGNQVKTSEEDYPYIGFQPSATAPGILDFYAYNGCNFLNGKVTVKNGVISHNSDFISTMKMCPDAEYELAIAGALEKMKSLKVQRLNNESFLYLNDAAGNTIMTLRRHNLNFLEGAWRVTQLGDTKVPAKAELQIVVDLSSNTIHGDAGCNVLNGSVNIDMDRENGISFSRLTTTRMTCPDIALEQSFLEALGNVRSAIQVGKDNAHLRDLAGNTIIILKRMSKEELSAD